MILNPKLLIVDDERGIVDMIQSYFQTQYDKSQKILNFLCFCGYYNRQMSAKYYNGQILKNIFLHNYIAG